MVGLEPTKLGFADQLLSHSHTRAYLAGVERLELSSEVLETPMLTITPYSYLRGQPDSNRCLLLFRQTRNHQPTQYPQFCLWRMNRTSVAMCLTTMRPTPIDDPQVFDSFWHATDKPTGTGDGTRTRIYRLERPITSIQLVDPSIYFQ